MKIGIINVTGYAGAELARILHLHPGVEIVSVTGRSAAGQKLGEVFPYLSNLDLTIDPDLTDSVDLAFSALPHAASAEKLGPLLSQGIKAIDLSGDFRLKELDDYQNWYNTKHPYPEYLDEAVYGLPELHREEIDGATLIASPGCYPTATILALAPAIDAGIIGPDIIVDAKSGVSGAGRGNHAYSEVNESVMAYKIDGHQHLPEIVQELGLLNASYEPRVTFVPHLIPMTRGILSSCYAPLKMGLATRTDAFKSEIREVYSKFYRDDPFVFVSDVPPMSKHALGSNGCIIFPTVDTRTNRLVVISCIDNLVKGAAGQAVQDMNIMFGFPEDEGLRQIALYP